MNRDAGNRTQQVVLAFATLIAALTPVAGWTQMDSIVVTSRRTEEKLQEVPIAVAAFDEERIEKLGLATTQKVISLVPGVTFDQSFSAADTRVSIRGINSTRGRTSVAVLVDGVDVSGENISAGGGSSLLNSRLLDLERVEIVKGPQAALYGRNAFAGAINYVTKQPSMDGFRSNVYADVAEYGTYDLRGSVSGPVIEDRLAVSLNAGWYETDGYYDNNNPEDPAANVGLGGAESSGARLGILWTPSEDVSVRTSVTYTENRFEPRAVAKYAVANTFYNQAGQQIFNPDGTPVTTPDFRQSPPGQETDPDRQQWYGSWRGTVGSVSEDKISLSRSERNNQPFGGSYDEQWLAYVRAEWTTDTVVAKSTTSYLNNSAWLHEDVDFQSGLGTPVSRDIEQQDGSFVTVDTFLSLTSDYLDQTDTEYFSQEFTVESSGWDRGRWLVGALGFWEDTENTDSSVSWFNAPNFGDAYRQCPPLLPLDLACSFRDSVILGTPAKETGRKTASYSVFGSVSYELTDALRVGLEARYIHDEIKVCTNSLVDRVSQSVLAYPYDYQIEEISGELLGLPLDENGEQTLLTFPLCATQRSDTINPRLTVDYRATPDIMYYASVAKGTKPAGFGTSQFAIPQTAEVRQEQLWAYELGAKTTWFDGQLLLNSALFYNDYTDRQVGITCELVGGFGAACVANAGGARTYGAELEMNWRATDNLTLALAYAYTRAEWTDFNYPEIRASVARGTYGAPARARDRALCQNEAADCSGAQIAGVPENAGSVTANYMRTLNESFDWFVNVNGFYEDKRALEDSNITAYVDSRVIVDAQIGIEGENLSVQLYADNLFDNDTVRWASYVPEFKDGMYGGTGGGEPRDRVAFAFLPPPRVVGLRATYKFGGP